MDLTSHDSMPWYSSQAPAQSKQKANKIIIFVKHVENCHKHIPEKVIRPGLMKITAEIKLRSQKGNAYIKIVTYANSLSQYILDRYLMVWYVKPTVLILSHTVKSLFDPDLGLQNICIHI